MKTEKTRIEFLKEFSDAPLDSYFNQATVCAIRCCSKATTERERWAGTGIPFIKMGRSVRYQKNDILNWLSQHQIVQSTAQVEIE
jgi:hypothetical protein